MRIEQQLCQDLPILIMRTELLGLSRELWAVSFMKILTWNVRGLGRREKRRTVRLMVARNQVDMLLLQESKLCEGDSKLIKSLWGKQNFQFRVAQAVGSARGLISIWDETFFLFGACGG